MIRPATIADVPQIVAMAERFVASSAYATHMALSAPHLTTFVSSLLAREDAALLVAERDGAVCGMVALYVFAHPFSGVCTASELVWWVEPEARGLGVRLLRAAERWARAQGATVMQMIAPNARVGDFYRRTGYMPIETHYQRRVA